jgi:hypothetical protein
MNARQIRDSHGWHTRAYVDDVKIRLRKKSISKGVHNWTCWWPLETNRILQRNKDSNMKKSLLGINVRVEQKNLRN